MRWMTYACLLIVVLPACSSSEPKVVPVDPTIATESVVLTSVATTVSAPPAATFSPAVTDPAQIQAILDALDRKEGDMFRAFVKARAVTPEVERLADEVFNFGARKGIEDGLRVALANELEGYVIPPETPVER